MIIGRVIKTRGLKGDLKIQLLTDFPERFSPGMDLLLKSATSGTSDRPVSYRIMESRVDGDIAFIRLKGVESLEASRALIGGEFVIPIEEIAPLEKGVYYPFQLIGLSVFTEAGKPVGILSEIYPGGNHDLYEVRNGKKEFLIPATREFVLEINLPEKKIVIHAREGLLED